MSENTTTRRNLVLGIASAGVALPLLSACGSAGSGDSADTVQGVPGPTGIPTSEIPVGGGKVFPDAGYVVTQPTAGTFKAFSSTCTHQGCTVNRVADGTIDCPCHFSKYSITDGSVKSGPAPKPLPEKAVTKSADGSLKVS